MSDNVKPIKQQPVSLSRTLFKYVIGPVTTVYAVIFIIIITSSVLITQSILQRQEAQISSIANQIEMYLTEIDRLLIAVGDSLFHLESEERSEYLSHIKSNNPRFTALYLVDPDGIVVIETSDDPVLLGLDLSGETFYSTRSRNNTYFSDPFVSLLAGDVVVTAAAPIYHDNQFKGLLVAELNLSKLQEVINQVSINEGFSFIVDSKGTFIAHPDSVLVRERQYFHDSDFLERARREGSIFEIIRDPKNSTYEIASVAQVQQDWFVITMQQIDTVLYPLAVLITISLAAFSITIFLFYLRIQASLSNIADPVSNLAEKAEQISKGDYDVEFTQSSHQFQEIASLENSFSRMLAGIQNRDRYLEQRVEQRTRQLEEANQDMEAFMYSVSHDLRAPLRAVIGYSDILTSDYGNDLDPEAKLYLDRILSQGERMDTLITDLLNLSRLGRQGLKTEQIDLASITQRVFSRETDKFDHGKATELVLYPTPKVVADPHLIEIMLTNLIDNAIKFSAKTTTPKIEFGYEGKDKHGYFFLRDNGVGFDSAYADKLFIPFQRLHDSEEFDGSGIGLAIVQRVIRSHDGRIWVSSKPGDGTTFYFTL